MTQRIVQILILLCVGTIAFSQIMNEQLEGGTGAEQFLVTQGSSPFLREFVDGSTINLSIFNNDAGFITGNQTITLSGDVTGSGTTSITTDIASGVVGSSELLDDGVKLVDIDYVDVFTNATSDASLTDNNYILFAEDNVATGGLKKTKFEFLRNFMESNMVNVLPAGGTSGQVLTKRTATDYDVNWQDPSSSPPLYNVSQTSTDIGDLYGSYDNYDYIRVSSSSAVQVDVNTTTEAIGSTITVEQTGAGSITITAGTGVTLNGVSLSTSNQYQILQVIKVASGVFTVIGG